MTVKVRLFAILRERAGADSVELDLPDPATVADAVAALDHIVPGLPVRIAVNREYAGDDATITAADELAAIPPVSGGSGAVLRARVSAEAIDPGEITALVSHPSAGAVVTFQGTTRDVDYLTYEAYAEMAEPALTRILSECAERHAVSAIAAEHRIGQVGLSEPSVVVAVSAPHRPEAFEAAREAIDRIKAEVPVWKKETEGSDERWVEGTVPS